MENPDVYFVFLVRDPHHTAISMYKKIADVFDTVGHQFTDVMGYKTLHDIFTAVKEHAVNAPYIMRTEDLYNNPQETISKFCAHVGIEFKPESLHWDNLGDQFDGQELWHEIKYKELTHHWHGDAIKSTGFGKPTPYEVDEQGIPTFSEIANIKHRNICKQVYQEHLPYYNLLIQDLAQKPHQ